MKIIAVAFFPNMPKKEICGYFKKKLCKILEFDGAKKTKGGSLLGRQ